MDEHEGDGDCSLFSLVVHVPTELLTLRVRALLLLLLLVLLLELICDTEMAGVTRLLNTDCSVASTPGFCVSSLLPVPGLRSSGPEECLLREDSLGAVTIVATEELVLSLVASVGD